MNDQDPEFEFNPRLSTPDVDHWLDRAARASEMARKTLNGDYDVRYGPGQLMTCDVFGAGDNAPVHVFFHGGYWKSRDKADYSFMVPAFLEAGVTLVIPNYDLCPTVSLRTIVRQTADCLRWVRANLTQWGADTRRLSVSGHSAGAHLVAMALSPDYEHHAIDEGIRQAVLISGLYDLEPVLGISVNQELGLTVEDAEQLSPQRHQVPEQLDVTLLVGAAETKGWIQQSIDYYRLLEGRASAVSLDILPGHDHFSIVADFEDANAPVTRCCIEAAKAS